MRAALLLGLCGLSAGLACSADDLGDDLLGEDDEVADTGRGGSSSGRAGSAATDGGATSTRGGAASNAPEGPGGSSSEQPPEPTELDDGAEPGETGIFIGMTAAHNAARAAVDADPPLPDLTWSNELAEIAQDWADQLTSTECGSIEHRMPNTLGENIAMHGSTRVIAPYSPEEAVADWNAEVACWDYGTISRTEQCDSECVAGLFSNSCGHYTQLIWRQTQRVGCGYSTCEDGTFTYEVWVCNYDPQGNIIGRAPY